MSFIPWIIPSEKFLRNSSIQIGCPEELAGLSAILGCACWHGFIKYAKRLHLVTQICKFKFNFPPRLFNYLEFNTERKGTEWHSEQGKMGQMVLA